MNLNVCSRYEARLERELIANGISFVREGQLRSLGFDKVGQYVGTLVLFRSFFT